MLEYEPMNLRPLRADEVEVLLKAASKSGLYSSAQMALFEERCSGYVAGNLVDGYEVLLSTDGGQANDFVVFRKRTLTEASYEISHIYATTTTELDRLLEALKYEVQHRGGKMIFAELPDASHWEKIFAVFRTCGYKTMGKTPHLYEQGLGSLHLVLYLYPTNFSSKEVEIADIAPHEILGVWPESVVRTDLSHREAILSLTSSTPVFNSEDRDTVEELLDVYFKEGDASGYSFLSCVHQGEVIAFACYGLRPGSAGAFDLYWIATDPRHRQQGAARNLMGALETSVLQQNGYLVVLDTSDTETYASTRSFYRALGYSEIVTIPGFYSESSGLVVFARYLKQRSVRE